jgi:DNA-binding transcriptional LysR family regulator
MWTAVELREIRVFLTLAEERHFGRTADRLHITPSRVSQTLRELETKMGAQLVNRTSRRVALTPLGDRFLAELEPAYQQLAQALERTQVATEALEGPVRVGLLGANSGGPHLTVIVEAFERRYPECSVILSEAFFTDPLGPLRRGDIDVMATRLPINQSDVTVGPTLAREPMLLAVAVDHPLAERKRVSIEDIANYRVAPITDSPKELIDAVMPRRTPQGRQIRRLTQRPKTPHELTALIARGRIVHPTVPSFAEYYGQPGITYVPIADMGSLKSGLVWLRRRLTQRGRVFVDTAREVLADSQQRRASIRSSRR